MTRFSKTVKGFVAVGMLVAVGSTAQAGGRPMTVRTSSLTPDPAGYLFCTVRADSQVAIDVTTQIVGAAGTNVTEFGSSFVASPIATGDGRYHVDNDAGSMHDDARYCDVTVKGARKHDLRITVTLESRDANGTVIEAVQGR